jgi:hypothetical protein
MERFGMNGTNRIARNDPTYREAVVKKKSQDDPKEVTIREKTAERMLREPWAREAFATIRAKQIEYLKEMVAHIDDADFVHRRTQETVRELSTLLKSEIAEGAELLETIPKGSPVLIATNHLGAYKLCGISPREDVGVDIAGYDAMYPYLMYFAALSPVADAIGDDISYVSEDFPEVFGDIHSKAGFVHVPPAAIPIEGGRTAFLAKQTSDVIEQHPHSAIVNFPEGGTSGKYTGLGIYDTDPFKTGGYVVAAELGIHVIPVAQYFDKDGGMQLRVFEPFIPAKGDKESFEMMAEHDRNAMQEWFDERKER